MYFYVFLPIAGGGGGAQLFSVGTVGAFIQWPSFVPQSLARVLLVIKIGPIFLEVYTM